MHSISSRVKDRLSGALGYIAGSKSPTGESLPAEQAAAAGEEKIGESPPELPDFSRVSALTLDELGKILFPFFNIANVS